MPNHIAKIDVLRGLAIIMVVLHHMLWVVFAAAHPGYQNYFLNITAVRKSWWIFSPLSFGWMGVSLFFVISGYVIHRSYLLDNNHSWLGFLRRRFWRIYPAYFVALILFTPIEHVLGDLDVLDLVEILIRGAHFVGIAQQTGFYRQFCAIATG